MSLKNSQDLDYFKKIADNVLMNRCPHCGVGMVIDTPTMRSCASCGYSDSSNVRLKVALKLEFHSEPRTKGATIVAKEMDGKISYTKEFVDKTTAQIYFDRIKQCLIR